MCYMVAGLLLLYHYFAHLPFFDQFASVVWGSLACNYLWLSFNALLMKLVQASGHLVIAASGLVLIFGLVYHGRKFRVRKVLLEGLEKMGSDVEALTQVINVRQMIKEQEGGGPENPMLAGVVNQHVADCQLSDCVCKSEIPLFDATSHSSSKRECMCSG